MPSSRPETLDRSSSVRRVLIRLLVANLAVVVAKLAVGIAANSLAVLLARQGWWWADPVVAIAAAVLIVRVAYSIVSQAVPVLVAERALPPGAIRESAEAVTGVKGAYGIRSRGAPPVRYAEVTIAV